MLSSIPAQVVKLVNNPQARAFNLGYCDNTGMENTIAEIQRRLENLVRIGTVSEVRHERIPTVRVKLGNILTNWLPLSTIRAGSTKTWSPPTPGEQVLVLSQSGDLSAGVVLPGIASNQNQAPDINKDNVRVEYADGATVDYNSADHHYQLTLPSAGKITLKVGATTLELSNSGTVLTTPRFDGVKA